MVKNVGCKIKCGKLMKNMKPPNSGLIMMMMKMTLLILIVPE